MPEPKNFPCQARAWDAFSRLEAYERSGLVGGFGLELWFGGEYAWLGERADVEAALWADAWFFAGAGFDEGYGFAVSRGKERIRVLNFNRRF